jgi:SPP1 gp7 family putative phage head morphogenesis protein
MARSKTGNHSGRRGPMPGTVGRLNNTAEPAQYALGDLVNAMTRASESLGPTQFTSPYGYMAMANDPRNLNDFGPLDPMTPEAIDGPRPDSGRPEPRLFEYAVGWNLPGMTTNRMTSFQTLRAAADLVDIIRQCIEVRKAHVTALDWAWTIDPNVITEAYRSGGGKLGREDVEQQLREKYAPDIARLTDFWVKPWKAQGIDFDNWVAMAVEEILVIDALSIHPSVTIGGDLLGFEILDGSTIKPLLDVRGGRPQYPFPAYQQEMYGFPRGEFQASYAPEDIEVIDGVEFASIKNGFTSDQLFYLPQNRRAFTPYGNSAVERAMRAASLYLARQGWMLAEYKDGSTPLTWLVPQVATANGAVAPVQMNPKQRREWEDKLNAELGGQTRARHRMKVTPPGFMPMQMPGVDERYKPDYDVHLIKSVAGPMGVTFTELGYSESQGLGNSGLHAGQADVGERVGTKPDVRLLRNLIQDISRECLKAPRELVFNFLDPNSDNEEVADKIADARLKRGSITLNDDRKRMGMPTYDAPEADRPLVYGPAPVLVDGIEAAAEAAAQQGAMLAEAKAVPPGTPGAPGAGDKPSSKKEDDQASSGASKVSSKPVDKSSSAPIKKADVGPAIPEAVTAELVTYRRWLKKNPNAKRPFEFSEAARPFLKAAGVEGDSDPKVEPADVPADARWPGWAQDLALLATYTEAIQQAVGGAVDAAELVASFLEYFGAIGTPILPAPDEAVEQVADWLEASGVRGGIADALRPILTDLAAEAYALGGRSAVAVTEHVMTGGDLTNPAVIVGVNWDDWRPGNVRAARRILSDDGLTVGLDHLLADFEVRLSGIAGTRTGDIAAVLADGLERGATADEIAMALRGILDDPKWAKRLANTEMTRALSAATLDVYRETGTTTKGWINANDEDVCKICNGNTDAGFIPLDEPFPSGVPHPPGHPWCRCALIPGIDLDDTSWLDQADAEFAAMTDEEAEAWSVRKADGGGGGASLKHYWTRGEGLAKWRGSAHPWTALYRHLRKHMAGRPASVVRAVTSRWFHDATGHWPAERKGKNPTGKG